ncbi:MAG: PspC domain-containing protein [Flavobacteriales bacterium]|nr:PspC domain-containing protein [Flavobacteriales bacterium]
MKKTLTANISGSVFHIEEDAYEKLQRYLATIRGNFSGSDGRDEIMGDIEGRIAELFTERLVGRQVVTVADVEHVISVMGQPEDYLGDEPGMGTGAGTDAGANAGTGAFAGPDPTRSRKRLFRDTEDRWVGGVLSGIAAYFGIDALVLRIIYILLLFIGVGWLLYIILWIVVPPAQSAADKLQMHGEPVTVDNIKRVVEEGAEHIRRGAQTVAGEAGDLGRRWSSDPSIKRGANEVSDFFVQVVHVILKAFGKLFGAVAFMLGILLAMALVFIIVGRYNFVWHGTDLGALGLEHLANAWFPDANMFGMTWLGVIFFLGAPAIGLIYGGLHLLFGLKAPRWFGWSIAPLWILGMVILGVVAVRQANEFRQSERISDDIVLQQPRGQVLRIATANDPWFGNDHSGYDNDLDMIHIDGDSIRWGTADLDVQQSPDSLFHLVIERKAYASDRKTAVSRARQVKALHSQRDSLLILNPTFSTPTADKLRGQRAHFIVQVPVGKAVHFETTSRRMVWDIDNVTDTWDSEMIGKTWTMTSGGLSNSVTPEQVPDDLPAPLAPKQNDPTPAPPQEPAKPADTRPTVALPNLFRGLSTLVRI